MTAPNKLDGRSVGNGWTSRYENLPCLDRERARKLARERARIVGKYVSSDSLSNLYLRLVSDRYPIGDYRVTVLFYTLLYTLLYTLYYTLSIPYR